MNTELRSARKSLSNAAVALVAAAALQGAGCALFVGGAVGDAAGGGAAAARDRGQPPMSYVGWVLASAVYFPAKVAFAVGGAITSGVAYVAALGNPEPSREIWDASLEGDY